MLPDFSALLWWKKELQFSEEFLGFLGRGQNDEAGSFQLKEEPRQAVRPGRTGQASDPEVFDSLLDPLLQLDLLFINAVHGL